MEVKVAFDDGQGLARVTGDGARACSTRAAARARCCSAPPRSAPPRVVASTALAGAFRGAERDFAELRSTPPVLVEGDVLNADATAELCEDPMTPPCCDPP